MSERRMQDEEIEALLRGQPRRRPSAALWARVEAGAVTVGPRRGRALVWAGAAVAVGVLAVLLVPRPAPGPVQVVKVAPPQVEVRPALPPAVAVPQKAVPAPMQQVVRVRHRVPIVASVVPREAPMVARAQAVSRPMPVAVVETPQTVAPAPTAGASDDSSYYLAVSQGDRTSSVLSGSVTRDSAQRVTQVSIAYDPAERADTKSVN